MSSKSPLEAVNEQFGAKDKLVDKLVTLLETDESKEELRKRLLGAANKKLLRLHRVATTVKEKYGSRDKLVAKTVEVVGRTKDKDYQTRLDAFSTSRLVDIAQAAERRAQRAAAAAKTATPKPAKKAAAKSPKAKAAKPAP
jgi:hypothetical protein